jgi:hypothetical protein
MRWPDFFAAPAVTAGRAATLDRAGMGGDRREAA